MLRSAFAVLLFALLLPALAQETLDRVLVVVDDELILESEVGQELQRYLMESGQDPQRLGEERLVELKLLLVEAMIDNKVLYAAARADTNIVVADPDIDRAVEARLEDILRRVGGQRRLETLMKQPLKEIRRALERDMRERLHVEEIQRRRLGSIKITRQEVEQFFASYADSLPDVGESVRLSHMFLRFKPSSESEGRALALADSVCRLLVAPRDSSHRFEAFAAVFSQDPASAENGGSIGRTKRGSLVRPYEEAAYRMKVGDISEPIRSDYGWHLIRLDGRQGEMIESSHILFKMEPTFEDRQKIYDRADSLYARIAAGEDFATLARRHTDHVLSREAGGDLGWVELEKLEPLARSRVRDLQAGEVSRPIRSSLEGEDGVQILRLIDHRQARRPTLDQDWAQIEAMALNWKKQNELQDWVRSLRSETYIRVQD
jgi:peptidyl-prolyl cis-trans isomerase SurA